jgi:hypothetical protein
MIKKFFEFSEYSELKDIFEYYYESVDERIKEKGRIIYKCQLFEEVDKNNKRIEDIINKSLEKGI